MNDESFDINDEYEDEETENFKPRGFRHVEAPAEMIKGLKLPKEFKDVTEDHLKRRKRKTAHEPDPFEVADNFGTNEEDIDVIIENYETRVQREVPEKFYSLVKRFAYHVSRGLSIEEICTLINFDLQEFLMLESAYPVIGELIEAKRIRLKRDLLATLVKQASDGDYKTAQWLLNSLFPDQFTTDRRSQPQEQQGDPIGDVLAFIRSTGDSTPLIKPENSISTGVQLEQKTTNDIDTTNHTMELEQFLK